MQFKYLILLPNSWRIFVIYSEFLLNNPQKFTNLLYNNFVSKENLTGYVEAVLNLNILSRT